MTPEEVEAYRKAGKIAVEVKKYAKKIVKKGMPLKQIAEEIENKIIELGGKPAFPVDLSIDDIAAHSSPTLDDKTVARGLLKVDIGIHVDGYVVDTALTLDLENNEENKKLIQAAESALKEAIKVVKEGIEIWQTGQKIQDTITSFKFSPIRNLSGHELRRYKIHAGLTIPNYNNNNKTKLPEGVYAIEPFSTTGQGLVYEGKSSGIYKLEEKKPVRSKEARKILEFIENNYKTLPFCERWLAKKFSNTKIALKFLEQEQILKQYPQLIEKGRGKVAQAEHTILINKGKVEILT